MWASHAAALLLLAALLAGWVWVQRAFRRRFPHPGGDPDALVGRTSCGGLGACGSPCETSEPCPRRRPPHGPQEDKR